MHMSESRWKTGFLNVDEYLSVVCAYCSNSSKQIEKHVVNINNLDKRQYTLQSSASQSR